MEEISISLTLLIGGLLLQFTSLVRCAASKTALRSQGVSSPLFPFSLLRETWDFGMPLSHSPTRVGKNPPTVFSSPPTFFSTKKIKNKRPFPNCRRIISPPYTQNWKHQGPRLEFKFKFRAKKINYESTIQIIMEHL